MLSKFFGHFCTINKHKWMVLKLCVKAGIPWRGIVHDLSKYSPTEFFESVKYYTGKRSPIYYCKKENGYSNAWLHHKGRNKHHYEYWYDNVAPDKTPVIPYKYTAEMICDNLAAGITYQGENWTKEYQKGYWERTRETALINEKIANLLTAVYDEIADKGIDEVINRKNLTRLYKEYVG